MVDHEATERELLLKGIDALAEVSVVVELLQDLPDEIVQLRRIATGEWLIDKLGPIGAVGSSK